MMAGSPDIPIPVAMFCIVMAVGVVVAGHYFTLFAIVRPLPLSRCNRKSLPVELRAFRDTPKHARRVVRGVLPGLAGK